MKRDAPDSVLFLQVVAVPIAVCELIHVPGKD